MPGTVSTDLAFFSGATGGASDCDSATDWTVSGIVQVGVDSEIKVQGFGCMGYKVSNSTGYAIFTCQTLAAEMVYFWAGFFDPIGRLNTFANGGLGLRLRSGTGNTREWYLAGKDTWQGDWRPWAVHVDMPANVNAGTFNPAFVDQVHIRWSTTVANKVSPNAAIDAIRRLPTGGDALRIRDGSSSSPATFQDMIALEETFANSVFPNRLGVLSRVDGILYSQGKLRIGSASSGDATFFRDLSEVLVFKEPRRELAEDYYQILAAGNGGGVTEVFLGQKSGTAGISGDVVRAGGVPRFKLTASDANLTKFALYGGSLFRPAPILLPASGTGRELFNQSFEKYDAITLSTVDVKACNFISGRGQLVSGGGIFTDCLVAGAQVEALDSQETANTSFSLYSGDNVRVAQRKTISSKVVTSLSFRLGKLNNPSGPVYFRIRKVSDDSVLGEILFGDASVLSASFAWYKREFPTPFLINEEVRIGVEFSGGDTSNPVYIRYANSDVKANEQLSLYVSSWTDYATDLAYRLGYVEGAAFLWNVAADPDGKLDNTSFISGGGGTGHGVEFGTDVNTGMSLRDVTFAGYGADGTSDAAVLNSSSKHITISILGAASPPTVKDTAGSSTTVVTGQRTHTVTDIASGGRVVWIRQSDEAQLENKPESGGSAAFTYTFSGNTVTDVQILSLAKKNKITVVTLGNADATLPAGQENDPFYTNPA